MTWIGIYWVFQESGLYLKGDAGSSQYLPERNRKYAWDYILRVLDLGGDLIRFSTTQFIDLRGLCQDTEFNILARSL